MTIVSWGYPLKKSLEAAELLQKEGIEAEVLDPRTLVPFDRRRYAPPSPKQDGSSWLRTA